MGVGMDVGSKYGAIYGQWCRQGQWCKCVDATLVVETSFGRRSGVVGLSHPKYKGREQ
jgi:hypothetical protein